MLPQVEHVGTWRQQDQKGGLIQQWFNSVHAIKVENLENLKHLKELYLGTSKWMDYPYPW